MRRRGVGVGLISACVYAIVIGSSGCGADTTGPAPSGELNVLFIGNSLTMSNALPTLVRDLLEAGGVERVVVRDMSISGTGLQDHWAGPARSVIAEGGWDIVVLQQGPSATEGRPSLLEYSQRFAEEIRAAEGVPALYMVWPSSSRLFDFDGVADSYTTAAELAQGLLFPVGEAWRLAWAMDPNLPLYSPDGFHPSFLGSYLAALVMYEQLSGLDPRDLPDRVSEGLSPELSLEVARTLQAVAVEANALYARPDK